MKYSELVKIVEGTPIQPPRHDPDITGFIFDSRLVKPGMCFVPIKTETADGHQYIKDAIDKGATCYLTHNTRYNEQKLEFPHGILVKDTYQAICKVASHNAKKNINRGGIAITGSAGKTTTKFLLSFLLTKLGVNHYVPPKSWNGWLGTPFALANLLKPVDIAVLEYGTASVGEIQRQLDIYSPDVRVLISLARAHTHKLGDIQGVIKEKGTIFNNAHKAVTRYEYVEKYYPHLKDHALTFGYTPSADVYIEDSRLTEHGTQVKFRFSKELGKLEPITINLSFYNKRIGENIAAAFLALDLLDVNVYPILHLLTEYTPASGRGAILKFKLGRSTVTVLDETYNANEISMKNALHVLNELPIPSNPRPLKIAVLGDMLELGDLEEEIHKQVLEFALTLPNIDYVLVYGSAFSKVAKDLRNSKLYVFDTIKDIANFIQDKLAQTNTDAYVLAKASNGLKAWELWSQWPKADS